MNLQLNEKTAKVILIGNSAVGKTSILIQLYRNTFDKNVSPTIGTSFITKIMEVSNTKVPLNIWDTAGQERFRSIIPMYMRGAIAAILVCATDSLESVQSLDKWYQLTQDISVNPIFYVVLNKIDLECCYDQSIPEDWAKNHGFKFFRTTAKEFDDINQLFLTIAEDILNNDISFAIQTQNANPQPNETKESDCC